MDFGDTLLHRSLTFPRDQQLARSLSSHGDGTNAECKALEGGFGLNVVTSVHMVPGS